MTLETRADFVLADRVVEVLHNAGGATGPAWNVGTGFVMHNRTVLTAAHNVSAAGEVLVRRRGIVTHAARLVTFGNGRVALDDDTDIALLQLSDDADFGDGPTVQVARLRGDTTLRTPNLDDCTAWGFPRFQQKVRVGAAKPLRESVRVDGFIPMGEGMVEGLATLRIRDAPHDFPMPGGDLKGSPWQGMSGAVVFAGHRAVGIVSEHHLPAGINGLTVVPLTGIDRSPDSAEWWRALGVAAPEALPRVPDDDRAVAMTSLTDEAVLERYRDMVGRLKDVANVTAPFGLVDTDLYIPRLLRPVDLTAKARQAGNRDEPPVPALDVVRSTNPLVVLGDAGSGKTELLHAIARNMLDDAIPGTPVPLRLHDFATRANGRDMLTFAVEETLGDSLGPDDLKRTIEVLRSRAAGDGGDVVYLFDAFDEVPVDLQEDVVTRVRRTPRFILTCRPMGLMDTFHNVATVYELAQLHDGAVVRFVETWTTHYPDTADLREALDDDPTLAELASLPQLLILLCWRWRSGGAGISSKVDILRAAVDGSLERAKRGARLPSGAEEDVPFDVRRALGAAALSSLVDGDGGRLTVSRDRLLELMTAGGDRGRASMLLSFARRGGLIVASGRTRRDFQFVHQEFRSFLAGEAIAEQDDPADTVERLRWRASAEAALTVATALDPERMLAVLLGLLEDDGSDVFSMDWRLVALCLSGLEEMSEFEHLLPPVVDAVFAGATSWWTRQAFAPVLGALRIEYTWQLLSDRIASADPYERWAAAEALGHLADSRGVQVLIERLAVESWPAINGAIVGALGRLRDPRAVPALVAHLETIDDPLASGPSEIGESLARLGAVCELRELIAQIEGRPTASQALSAALPFVDDRLAHEIRKAFSQNGITVDHPEDIQRYLDVLYDEHAADDDRINAIDGLASVGTQDVVSALCDTLAGESARSIRDQAAQALASIDDDVGFHGALDYMVDEILSAGPQADAASAALLSLWNSPAQSDLADLSWSTSEEPPVREADDARRAAAVLVAALRGFVDLQALTELIDSPDPRVREAAISVVKRFAVTDCLPLVVEHVATESDPHVRYECLRALAMSDSPSALPILEASLDATDPAERGAAADSIAVVGDRGCVDLLLDRLEDEQSPAVVVALIRALVRMCGGDPPPPRLVDKLISLLDCEVDWIRQVSARATGDVGTLDAAPVLYEMMRSDPSESVRDSATEALSVIAPLSMLLEIVEELATAAPAAVELMATVANAMLTRDAHVVGAIRQRIDATDGVTVTTNRKATLWYPTHSYIISKGSDDTGRGSIALLADLRSGDAAVRWDAVDELDRFTSEPAVLGNLAVMMFDENGCVAERACGIISNLAHGYQMIDSLDDESMALLCNPDNLRRLIGALHEDDRRSWEASWLLAQPEFLPALLEALDDGHQSVRRTLWNLAERFGLRLLPDHRAVLASGEVVSWDDLPARLRPTS